MEATAGGRNGGSQHGGQDGVVTPSAPVAVALPRRTGAVRSSRRSRRTGDVQRTTCCGVRGPSDRVLSLALLSSAVLAAAVQSSTVSWRPRVSLVKGLSGLCRRTVVGGFNFPLSPYAVLG